MSPAVAVLLMRIRSKWSSADGAAKKAGACSIQVRSPVRYRRYSSHSPQQVNKTGTRGRRLAAMRREDAALEKEAGERQAVEHIRRRGRHRLAARQQEGGQTQ